MKSKWLVFLKKNIPEEYEEWFEKMSLNGLHLAKRKKMSSFKLDFKKGEPKNYKYVLDLLTYVDDNYYDRIGQFGYEYVGQLGNSYIWRKEVTTEMPVNFADMSVRKKRNGYLRKSLIGASAFLIICMLICVASLGIHVVNNHVEESIETGIDIIIITVIAGYMIYVAKKIKKKTS